MRLGEMMLVVLSTAGVWAPVLRAQPPASAVCREWHECQGLALAAADRGEYELFHDLAWRAVQTGPRNDLSLMYLLARAQSLSGRVHDALVMLGRLADAGELPADAMTSDDFKRVRLLPGWPDFEARTTRPPDAPERSMLPPAAPRAAVPTKSNSTAAGNASNSIAAPAPAAATLAAPTVAAPAEARRFRTDTFSVAGLAYDAVSQRFLFGDRHGRKLRVVGDRSSHADDLARADSGGFREIGAIAIDARRGDLWVASAGGGEAAGLLHKIQLISGRPLRTFTVAADGAPVAPSDVSVTASGSVVLLDGASGRVLMLRPGHSDLDVIAHLKSSSATSITVGEDEDTAYVASDQAVAHVSLRSGTTSTLSLPKQIAIGSLEVIRAYRRSIVGIDRVAGSRRVVRLELNDRGTAVTRASLVADRLPPDGRVSAAISGDELVYVVDVGGSGTSETAEVVVYRIALR
jgi:hypothetical protein